MHETIREQLHNGMWISGFSCKPISKKEEIKMNLSRQESWVNSIFLAWYLNGPYLSDDVYVAEQERRLSLGWQWCDLVNGEKAECDTCRGREWDGLTWRGVPSCVSLVPWAEWVGLIDSTEIKNRQPRKSGRGIKRLGKAGWRACF